MLAHPARKAAAMACSTIRRMSPADPEHAKGVALREAKLALRSRILLARDALTPEERSRASDAITARLTALPAFERASTVLLTLAFRSEWNTMPLIVHALSLGKTVALPRVDTNARMLELHRVLDPAEDVDAGYRGIPEPRASCPVIAPASVEWVLVPGVAFDRQGRRLGYGGGFYDRLLPLVATGTPRVAAAYSVQLVDRVPSAPHDMTVDTIVTETETITIGARR